MKLINSALLFAIVILGCGSVVLAQQNTQSVAGQIGPNASVASDTGVASVDSTTTTALATSGELSATDQPDPSGSGTAPSGAAADEGWHFAVSPYLWLPGVHGTAGAFGNDVGFKASAGDLLSKAKLAFLGAAEARRSRFVTTLDLLYMRLEDDKATPFPNVGASSADVKVDALFLTPKVGVRLINQEKIKADFLTGFRYWHFGEDVTFVGGPLGVNFSKSQDFVDPLVGGRILAALSPKIVATIAGDVGGWGAGSQLEYQAVGLLGYKIKPKVILQAGYRYLYLDYQKSGIANASLRTAFSGVILGVTFNLK